MDLSEKLRSDAVPIWERLHEHAFVNRLADGTLTDESFRYFIGQDYKFLSEYSRSLAFCIARSPDISTMRYFSSLLNTTLTDEMVMYESYAESVGLSPAELARQELRRPAKDYADFLLDTTAKGVFVEGLAALLPCVWSYVEIGQKIVSRGLLKTSKYSDWVEAYAAPGFVATSDSFRRLVNNYLTGSSEDEWVSARRAFFISSGFELAVWDAALTCGDSVS